MLFLLTASSQECLGGRAVGHYGTDLWELSARQYLSDGGAGVASEDPSLRIFILYHQKWYHNGAAPAFHQSFSHETGAMQCRSHLISNTPRSGHYNCSPDKLLGFVLDAGVTSLVLHVPCRAPFAWVRPWVQALSQGLWVAAPRR